MLLKQISKKQWEKDDGWRYSMWNKYWVLCFTPFYCVLRDTRSATESGGFVVGYGMDKHEGMMTIGVWCLLPCGGRATHSCSIHLACRARGTSMLESFLVFTINLRMTRRNANLKFSLPNFTSLVNSTRGYFPDLIFTSATLQRRACALRLHLHYRLHNLLLTTWSMQWLGTTHNQVTKKNLEVFQKQYLFMVSPHFIFSPSPPLASFSLNFSLIGL